MEEIAVSSGTTPAQRATPAWMNIMMALLAGVITLLVLQTFDPVFQVDEKYNIEGLGAADDKWVAYLEQKRIIDLKNVALFTGVLGASVGIALAFSRPTHVALGWRVLGGAVLGAGCGLLAGSAGCFLQQYFVSQGQVSLIQSTMVQALLFGLLGVGLGAVFGGWTGGARRIGERAASGLVAGLIAGIAYPVLASVLLATVNIEATIPQDLTAQVLWVAVGSVLLGWLIPRDALKGAPSPATDGLKSGSPVG